MDTIHHNPARLYNCDENGITIVEQKHTKILGLKGKRQISSIRRSGISCDSRHIYESNWTLHLSVTCISKKKNMKPELMNSTPPASIHACHPSGWTQSEIFTHWFLHFIKHTKVTKVDPFILVLDGHYSHTRNLEVITLARENHVDMICLPRIKLSWGP